MTVRFGILGHGWAAEKHGRGALECGAQLIAVAGRDKARAAAAASEFNIDRVTDDWREVTRADDIDAVIVATPNVLHAEQCLDAIAHGKHVLVDKPMAVSVAEGKAIVDAAAVAGVVLLVGHMWRYRDEVVAMRDRVAAGELGRIVRTRGYGIHEKWGPDGWFVDLARSGGGALIDMGVHAVDTVRFLLGDPMPVRVQASLGTAYGDYDVDDDGVILVDWDNGTRSVIEFGWHQPYLSGIEADTELFGTKGYARIWPYPEMGGLPEEHAAQPMYTAQMRDFIACIETGGTPLASGDAGLVALSVVQAAYESARTSTGILL